MAEVIAFIGAGGKTTSLLYFEELAIKKKTSSLLTTTTKMLEIEVSDKPIAFASCYEELRKLVIAGLAKESCHLRIFRERLAINDKVAGLNVSWIESLHLEFPEIELLIEADGARGKGLKWPYAHEPVLPKCVTKVYALASSGVLGKPLTEEWVYNPAGFGIFYGKIIDKRVLDYYFSVGGKKQLQDNIEYHGILVEPGRFWWEQENDKG
ncbi:MAG: selenium cofactor biosynthesis protein YqeC [Clostridia bacterium]